MTALVAYVSGHGFGHAIRVIEVLKAISALRQNLDIEIRTTAPSQLFYENLQTQFTYTVRRLDVGAVQRDSLTIDPEASLREYAELAKRKEQLIAEEVEALSSLQPSLILADIPALAFNVADSLGVPGIALGNFSWDWIYADYVRDFPAYAELVDGLRASYSLATSLLRTPFHGDLSSFPHVRDIPLVARHATLERSEVRRRLSFPERKKLVLLSFGAGLSLANAPLLPPETILVAPETEQAPSSPPWCHSLPTSELHAAGVRYEDLVAASDAVVTKPGFGIVAECIANRTRIVYTPRGRFAEYPVLVEAIQRHLPHAFIDTENLLAGRWIDALENVFAQPRRAPVIDTNGAAVAAAVLLEHLAV